MWFYTCHGFRSSIPFDQPHNALPYITPFKEFRAGNRSTIIEEYTGTMKLPLRFLNPSKPRYTRSYHYIVHLVTLLFQGPAWESVYTYWVESGTPYLWKLQYGLHHGANSLDSEIARCFLIETLPCLATPLQNIRSLPTVLPWNAPTIICQLKE